VVEHRAVSCRSVAAACVVQLRDARTGREGQPMQQQRRSITQPTVRSHCHRHSIGHLSVAHSLCAAVLVCTLVRCSRVAVSRGEQTGSIAAQRGEPASLRIRLRCCSHCSCTHNQPLARNTIPISSPSLLRVLHALPPRCSSSLHPSTRARTASGSTQRDPPAAPPVAAVHRCTALLPPLLSCQHLHAANHSLTTCAPPRCTRMQCDGVRVGMAILWLTPVPLAVRRCPSVACLLSQSHRAPSSLSVTIEAAS
jgi:hypothetical protein